MENNGRGQWRNLYVLSHFYHEKTDSRFQCIGTHFLDLEVIPQDIVLASKTTNSQSYNSEHIHDGGAALTQEIHPPPQYGIVQSKQLKRPNPASCNSLQYPSRRAPYQTRVPSQVDRAPGAQCGRRVYHRALRVPRVRPRLRQRNSPWGGCPNARRTQRANVWSWASAPPGMRVRSR
jgi:hypothetical protein